jgi:hypothetical protein
MKDKKPIATKAPANLNHPSHIELGGIVAKRVLQGMLMLWTKASRVERSSSPLKAVAYSNY